MQEFSVLSARHYLIARYPSKYHFTVTVVAALSPLCSIRTDVFSLSLGYEHELRATARSDVMRSVPTVFFRAEPVGATNVDPSSSLADLLAILSSIVALSD